MFNLGPLELVAIFIVALLVFGPEKLPEIGRQVGRGIKEFRRIQDSLQDGMRDALDPITGAIKPDTTPTAPKPPPPPDGEAPPTESFGSYGPSESTASSEDPTGGAFVATNGSNGSAVPAHPAEPGPPGPATPPVSSPDPDAG